MTKIKQKKTPHQEAIGYNSKFSLTKNASYRSYVDSGMSINRKVFVYHFIKTNPQGVSNYDIHKATGIKVATLCKTLRTLSKEGKIFKAFDAISKDRYSGKFVHHYQATVSL